MAIGELERLGKGRVDWALALSMGGLLVLGTLAVVSAASPLPYYGQILKRHALALVLGGLGFLFGMGLNYRIFQDQSKFLYAAALGLMGAVLLFGETLRGSRGWLDLGFFLFQPSELVRVLTLLVLAGFLESRALKVERLSTLAGACGLTAPIVLLILLEPDFSSTLTFFPIVACMVLCAGGSPRQLVALAGLGALSLAFTLLWTYLALRPELVSGSPALSFVARLSRFNLHFAAAALGAMGLSLVAWKILSGLRLHVSALACVGVAMLFVGALAAGALGNSQLRGYQRKRFVAYLSPEADPKGASYNVQQAQIAIGSGGLTGKGVFSGTQSQLGFLPERHTDFIFAVIGEEMGLVGTVAVLGLYLTLLWRIVKAARASRDGYGYLVCCGLASMFGFCLLLNVGMCVGFFPVAGIPLPLVSYGGSGLTTSLWALGIVQSVYSRRYAFL